jgi:starch synthase
VKILYAASEAAPFCKTGGLADVAGSLPPALARGGAETAVILPLYQSVREKFGDQMEYLGYTYIDLAWRHAYCGLFQMKKDGVTWYFLDNEQYFKRPELYGYYDDGERFGFFSRAVVGILPMLGTSPDVIHCNDWQTSLIPIYLRDLGMLDLRLRNIRTVLSIHNIEYQGRFGRETLEDLFGLNRGWADDGTLMMDGDVNLLKGAILCADAVNAVSPTYARQIQTPQYAHGLDSVMRMCGGKLTGILNGIDTRRYDPAADPDLEEPFSAQNLSGKAGDKRAVQQRLGLEEISEVPLIGMVSRLVGHKGMDLVRAALDELMKLDVQLAVVGKGDPQYEAFFQDAAARCPGRVAVSVGYDEKLAMAVYAGADLYLMPSLSEPCGLSQMIAMRYGAVPVVRETGGLKDSVLPYDAETRSGSGFTFRAYDPGAMANAVSEAVGLYRSDPEAYRALQLHDMQEDFSWSSSAACYLNLYEKIVGMRL